MDERRALAFTYFNQQKELGMPDIFFGPAFDAGASLETLTKPADTGAAPFAARRNPHAIPRPGPTAGPGLLPLSNLMGREASDADKNDPVRNALVELYNKTKNCRECGLGKLRTKFVFGSGSPHARLMIIGEAPGEEEDLQGLPFVGRAGELLTRMLAAIDLDRKKDVFIANVLKCRPPANRNPETSEILSCSPILAGQIDIIKPKVILLLGRVAAHALLSTNEGIGALRGRAHSVNGIPAYVTYHPASLLRNQAYKRPAWDDMRRLREVLTEAGVYAGKK